LYDFCLSPAQVWVHLNPLESVLNSPVRTSQETHRVYIKTSNLLILLRDEIGAYFESHTRGISTLRGRVGAGGT
jgi:hypothetical protein